MEKNKLKLLMIPIETSIKQAMQNLSNTGEKILFVVDDKNVLLGTITDGDIRKKILMGVSLNHSVKHIMQVNFISCQEENPDKISKAVNLMKSKQVDQIPVVTSKGVIVDVLSWIDYIEKKSNVYPTFDNSVVIMAGGKGTRLDPFTRILPKPLIPIQNKPIIEHIMDKFYENGFHKFTLIVNYKKEIIKMYCKENSFPYQIDFIDEDQYLGTAGGLSLLNNGFDDAVFITNCDTILEADYFDILRWHKEKMNIISIIGTHKEITVPYGVLKMAKGALQSIDEKPKYDIFINTGFYIIEPNFIEFIDKNTFVNMDKILQKVLNSFPEKVGVYPHWGNWFDIGQWDEYKKSLQFLEGK